MWQKSDFLEKNNGIGKKPLIKRFFCYPTQVFLLSHKKNGIGKKPLLQGFFAIPHRLFYYPNTGFFTIPVQFYEDPG